MPPHCDSLDGPVVMAALRALQAGDADLILPYVPASAEAELLAAFAGAQVARRLGPDAADLADRWFFETAVRLHREGEGAPFTGLKPAGLDVGPIIPIAERSLESGDPSELAETLCGIVRGQVEARVRHAVELAAHASHGVGAARESVSAALGLQVWAHALYRQAVAAAHSGEHSHSD